MPLDTCINNVGEYYSSHYLDSTFTKDLKDLVKRWKDEGSQAPPKRVQSLAESYFQAKAEALDVRKVQKRLQFGAIAGWHGHLLHALGYHDYQQLDMPVAGNTSHVPVLGRINRYSKPWLLLCEAPFCLPESSLRDGMAPEEPLEVEPLAAQLSSVESILFQGDWSKAIARLFTEEEAPRWILFLAGAHIYLFDKHTYSQGRYLVFDLDDAFGRKEKATFEHTCAFLSAETLCPEGESDEVLHDRLEEQSHRFAHGVTEKLQLAVREAIEILVNEWVEDRRRRKLSYTERTLKDGIVAGKSSEITAEDLRHESLIYVYRLLFCFYAEARGGELGILPITDDIYQLGYSLESLRDLEQVPLTPATEAGLYFHTHLRKLFTLIHQGFNPAPPQLSQMQLPGNRLKRTFSLQPLTATLFDPKSTSLLDNARLTNLCLQKVIRRLSLSVDERTRTIGRVNYAELGINQLGAVYEGLLSYKGMFAETDLIQVKPANKSVKDKKTPTWFVPKDRLEEFKRDEVELVEGKPRIYPKGSFILHLSGIDREQSASYYTPEVLTRCLVEEALRELLGDYTEADADKILELKICEPAMGSGAFLNEATGQLAEKYLELKQKQLGTTIDPARYLDEWRRVKHYIATRNVYGVDLNETAVELGALSLWLGSVHRLLIREAEDDGPDMYKPGATPWFGLRLRCGNSLIGARRAVWKTEQLAKGKHYGTNSEVPKLLKPGEQRGQDEIYHFLVFDEEMVPASRDRLMRDFWPDECSTAREWINGQVKKKWAQPELQEALTLCDLIDEHWQNYTQDRLAALEETACTATVWPEPSNGEASLSAGPSLEDQEIICEMLEATSGSFQRLKLLMDCWCSLWFWPLDHAGELPNRMSFLAAAKLLLSKSAPKPELRSLLSARLGFEVEILVKAAGEQVPDTESLADAVPWLGVSQNVAKEQHFHHWELVYPEVLGPTNKPKGFDLIIGNPPWVGIEWNDTSYLSNIDPLVSIRGGSSPEFEDLRSLCLNNTSKKQEYTNFCCAVQGITHFLNNRVMYDLLGSTRSNLYKNFIVLSWGILGENGVGSLLHPESVFLDEQAKDLRENYYQRLLVHFQFQNWLKLFADVKTNRKYSVNVYTSKRNFIKFKSIFNLVHPVTIGECFNFTQNKSIVPGIKRFDGGWEKRGHVRRIIEISDNELAAFSDLIGDSGAIKAPPLVTVHSYDALNVLKKISSFSDRLCDFRSEYFPTQMLNETTSRTRGVIEKRKNPVFYPSSLEDLIFILGHIQLATPYDKEPISNNSLQTAFKKIDLSNIPKDYIPCSIYAPGEDKSKRELFDNSIPRMENGEPITSHFRYINRRRSQPEDTRTLINAIIPPGPKHVDSLFSITFKDYRRMVLFSGLASSICYDFFVRAIGKENIGHAVVGKLPIIDGKYSELIINRALRLNCVTEDYANLWECVANSSICKDSWTVEAIHFSPDVECHWCDLEEGNWTYGSAVRSDFSRRQAILELDVLASLTLGIELDELITIYDNNFSSFKKKDESCSYDGLGQLLLNKVSSQSGGISGSNEFYRDPIQIEGEDGVKKTFYPPFTKVDREADYERAYAVFQQRFGGTVSSE